MIEIGVNEISSYPYGSLIEDLRRTFSTPFEVPQRHHHDFPNPTQTRESSLLLMPAWSDDYIGVKMVVVSPENGSLNLPSIQGTYTLFDVPTGTPVATIDAKALTTKRTAATSALAADYLAPRGSSTLLVVGTGALAPELIRAHCTTRDIRTVKVWGRNIEKAEKVIEGFGGWNANFEAVEDLESAAPTADIISVATLSKEPLLMGEWLKEGTHVDLVGAYRKDMREANDEVLQRSSVFVDTYQGATKETGDLYIPLEKGIISLDDIQAELSELCGSKHPGRKNEEEITVFKSVGHAIEDLAGAVSLYEKEKDK